MFLTCWFFGDNYLWLKHAQKDISAKKKKKGENARFPEKVKNFGREKDFTGQKKKRKEKN